MFINRFNKIYDFIANICKYNRLMDRYRLNNIISSYHDIMAEKGVAFHFETKSDNLTYNLSINDDKTRLYVIHITIFSHIDEWNSVTDGFTWSIYNTYSHTNNNRRYASDLVEQKTNKVPKTSIRDILEEVFSTIS